jgi:DNA polymerase-3 subunit gamma/tau
VPSITEQKKKLEGVRAVSFRALPILEVKESKDAGKGKDAGRKDAEKGNDAGNTETRGNTKNAENTNGARLDIETPKNTQIRPSANSPMAEGQSAIRNPQLSAEANAKAGSAIANEKQPASGANMTLANIRNKIANQQRKKEELTKLNEELLHQAWGQYIEKLIELKNPSAVTNFKHAILRVIDENTFEISTESVIQQKFIEQERGQLIAHLQDFFKNRQLSYQLVLQQKEENESAKEKPLSSREQYLKIIEMYPLVKELKDRLGMDLDY